MKSLAFSNSDMTSSVRARKRGRSSAFDHHASRSTLPPQRDLQLLLPVSLLPVSPTFRKKWGTHTSRVCNAALTA